MVVRLMRKLFFIGSFFSFVWIIYTELFTIADQQIKLNDEAVQ
jgi:hypothetical protein